MHSRCFQSVSVKRLISEVHTHRLHTLDQLEYNHYNNSLAISPILVRFLFSKIKNTQSSSEFLHCIRLYIPYLLY